MSKLKVGYWPLSQNLESAGDRRRVVFWANARGHEIVSDLHQKVDVVVASEKSDFNSKFFTDFKGPIVFDLIDAYLSPLNPYDDLARGLAKRLSGQLSGEIKPFSDHVRDFCKRVDVVICSSVEQEEVIKPHNPNIHVILDSHDEFPFIEARTVRNKPGDTVYAMWEGQPATIRGVREISSTLIQVTESFPIHFDFVTDEKYKKILGKYIESDTFDLLNKDLSKIMSKVSITPWTIRHLIETAQKSKLGFIPIDLSVPMQRLKPENRLLIMWRLGLPCLTSSSPAYVRVANEAGVSATCHDSEAWFENFTNLVLDSKFALYEVQKGQEYLRAHHTQNILLSKWDAAIQSALG